MTYDEFLATRLAALLRYATVLTCDPHLAQDIVQNVLLRAQSRWRRITALDQPEAYVKRMVLNEFLSWRRRLANRWVSLPPPEALPTTDPTGAVVERRTLVGLIATLPPRQRAVIVLRFYEDLTDPEIAVLLDCRISTVRSHSSRAIATLRAALADGTAAADDVLLPEPIGGRIHA
ncbi:RNA polymerase sigma-70 factor (sigma-E family) [Allocatelliglobosispora scoriae]|uniref:RNA polymerase sigma-70 factor (Sigma-E family) n=1 Tax=Allocatelliglobosispora scoriae TaxID=643052 RepID=A0A841C1T1_9ACTN|nr:SigE family RNA polymerase sigma factor [Allocatelliglobosispora scoriae]MBB5873103.1 RNA polymerase sigma-70 factor (sigma-E family) [Allocatelliglobosispora scoriae]